MTSNTDPPVYAVGDAIPFAPGQPAVLWRRNNTHQRWTLTSQQVEMIAPWSTPLTQQVFVTGTLERVRRGRVERMNVCCRGWQFSDRLAAGGHIEWCEDLGDRPPMVLPGVWPPTAWDGDAEADADAPDREPRARHLTPEERRAAFRVLPGGRLR